MKAVVAAFNQEKALVGAFSVLTNLRMELFQALVHTVAGGDQGKGGQGWAGHQLWPHQCQCHLRPDTLSVPGLGRGMTPGQGGTFSL